MAAELFHELLNCGVLVETNLQELSLSKECMGSVFRSVGRRGQGSAKVIFSCALRFWWETWMRTKVSAWHWLEPPVTYAFMASLAWI